MSGSLVLRSGVGTQILIVSSCEITEKSVVAGSPILFHQPRHFFRGNIADIGIAGVDAGDLRFDEIDARHRKAGLGELDRQGQAQRNLVPQPQRGPYDCESFRRAYLSIAQAELQLLES